MGPSSDALVGRMRPPTTVLYRAVGRDELDLIRKRGFRAFPPPPLDQRVLKPMLTNEYAFEVAQDWSKEKSQQFSGYVLQFQVETAFLDRHAPHKVGGSRHREYWIPVDELDEFNGSIRGRIELVAELHGVPDDAA